MIPEFNQVIFSSEIKGENFIVSRYIEGAQLSTILYKNNNTEIIAKNIINFYKKFNNISVKGYGNATYNLKAPYTNWVNAIENQLIKIEQRSKEFNDYTNRKYTNLLRNNYRLIDRQFKPILFPADFNLSNFFITKKSSIKVIESEYYYIGDPLTPYGALLAHIYGTKLAENFLKILSNENLKILSFYAIWEAVSVWSFNYMIKNDSPEKTKPFGNKNTFHQIIEKISENLSRISK